MTSSLSYWENLTNFIYIIRKVGTNYTQCVYRIRLRAVTPQGRIDDLTIINFENFQRDPSLGHNRGGPTLFDESIPSLLEPPTTGVATQNATEVPPPFTVSVRFPITPAPVPIGLAVIIAPLPAAALAATKISFYVWNFRPNKQFCFKNSTETSNIKKALKRVQHHYCYP